MPLHLINFVRTQAELLNSFYGHGLGHFYDAPTFRAYQLNGELDRLPVRRNQLIAGHGLNRLVEQIRLLRDEAFQLFLACLRRLLRHLR